MPRRSERQRRWRSRISIDGYDELMEMFQNIPDAAASVIEEAAKAGTEVAYEDAKRRVPVKTGALRDAMIMAKEKSRKKTKSTWRIKSKKLREGGVRYMLMVEFGTKKMEPQPFLRPAIDNNKLQIIEKVNQTVVNAVDRVI
jgi:HK97 gp10 family phage protein